MFERFARSWRLIKASWAVLRADKELIIFPVISSVLSIVVMISFLVPSIMAGIFDEASESGFPIAGYIVAFLFYIVMYTVSIFFSSAVVGAAMIRLNGGDPTVGDGFRIAFGKLGVIVQYAVIAATVGMILQALRERGGIVGSIVSSLGGLAWSIATFLVVPILVMEDISPLEAIKRSTSLLKQTWGEQLVGSAGMGFIFILMIFAAILSGIFGVVMALSLGSEILAGLIVALVIFAIFSLTLVSATLNGIYLAAVYRYATVGETSQYFDSELVEGAFKVK